MDIDKLRKIVDMLLTVVTIIGILYGIKTANSYKKNLDKKRKDSLFNFYARLKIYLMDFKNRLGASPDESILLYKCPENSLRTSENIKKPAKEEIKYFMDFIRDFINFLKNTEEQISLDNEFNCDFGQFKNLLFKLVKLDEMAPYDDRNFFIDEYNSTNLLVNKLLFSIDTYQESLYIGVNGILKNFYVKRRIS
jgi:hypothetical protein